MGWGRLAAGPGGLFSEGPSSGSLADSEHSWGLVKGPGGLQEFNVKRISTLKPLFWAARGSYQVAELKMLVFISEDFSACFLALSL